MSEGGRISYWEKLQSPKWQKKRLEILSRDNFTCQTCGSQDNQLHVHHRYYVSAREPWEYPDSAFESLCKSCHEDKTAYDAEAARCGFYLNWESLIGDVEESKSQFQQIVHSFGQRNKLKSSEVIALISHALQSGAFKTSSRPVKKRGKK